MENIIRSISSSYKRRRKGKMGTSCLPDDLPLQKVASLLRAHVAISDATKIENCRGYKTLMFY